MNEGLPVDREVTFPIWRKFNYCIDETRFPKTFEPGRIILNQHYIGWEDTPVMCGSFIKPDILDILGPNDIVYVPLYAGDCEHSSEGTSERAPWYDHNRVMLAEIAQVAKAALFGNTGCELSFKHFFWRDPARGMKYASERAQAFIREVGTFSWEAGIQPAFGTIDWDLGMDCWRGDRLLRSAILEVQGLQICFRGADLLTRKVPEEYYRQVEPPEQGGFDADGNWIDMPELRDYLTGTQTLGGVGHVSGLQAGYDALLAKAGFVGGTLGVR